MFAVEMSKLGIAAVVLSAAALSATAHAGTPAGTFAGCPAGLRPVPANYLAATPPVAVRFAKAHAQGTRTRGAHATLVLRVPHWFPSGWIKTECGLTVWQRSVAVNVEFPAMEYPNPKGPCDACAHLVYLLGYTAHGWKVWGNY
jgi:hypothetical protein